MTEVPIFYATKTPKTPTDEPVPDPFQLKEPTSEPTDEWWKSIPVPWKNISVLIVGNGELKGRTGRVRDVHIRKKTLSGLEVDVELDTYSGSNSFKRRRLDYDHVVESEFVILPFLFFPLV